MTEREAIVAWLRGKVSDIASMRPAGLPGSRQRAFDKEMIRQLPRFLEREFVEPLARGDHLFKPEQDREAM